MKLYQALKLKNKLVGEIAELQGTIIKKNSKIKGDVSRFDLNKINDTLELKKQTLVALKTAITQSNAPIQSKIFELSEMKSTVKFWNSVSTKEGKEMDRWTKEMSEYEVIFNEVEILTFRKTLEANIEKLQEELDAYNHTTDLSDLSFDQAILSE